jgi:hypothetical protein
MDQLSVSGTIRKFCRNPRCRTQLPEPAHDDHAAFCCKGCWRQFHHKRCIVCEAGIERTVSNRLICKRSRCRNELRLSPSRYRPFDRGFSRQLDVPATPIVAVASDLQEVPILCESKRHPFGVEQALSANRSRIRAPRHVIEAVFGRMQA